jgi:hypothetical protein
MRQLNELKFLSAKILFMAIVYSLIHPTEATLEQIGLGGEAVEGGLEIIKQVLHRYNIQESSCVPTPYSATEIRIASEKPLPEDVLSELSKICEVKKYEERVS